MPHFVCRFLLPAVFFTSLCAWADPSAVYATCAACHGEKGQGNTQMQGPVLAGLSADYLTRQLLHFQNGSRGQHADDVQGQQMAAMAKSLLPQDSDIQALAAYIEKMPVPNEHRLLPGDLKTGNAYYQNNCGACHGGQGQGNPALKAPRLAAQDMDYLRRQFMHFKQGLRGNADADKAGRQMAMMAKVLPDDKIEDVLAFISSL
ncbi:c-type cytochrome [Bowmanella denitrificans]